MGKRAKRDLLKDQGVLNRNPKKVKDPMFCSNTFFDPDDLAQVKYEMIRQVSREGKSISEVSETFGISRPTFYQAKSALEREGLLGLTPQKPGPKNRHKLNDEIMDYVNSQISENEFISIAEIKEQIQEKFSVIVHQRSIKRALASKKKISDNETEN